MPVSIILLLFCNNLILQLDNYFITDCNSRSGKLHFQRAKKGLSDSLGLVDFAIGLVILFLTCPTGKCCFFGKFKLQEDCNQSCKSKRVLGLAEMTCGLVHVSYHLPNWKAVKLTFFALSFC